MNAPLETKLKAKIRRSKIQKVILGSLYAAGMVSAAVFAPNVVSALYRISGGKKKKNQEYSVRTAIGRLRGKGLVKWEETDRGVFLRLTPQGEQALSALEKQEFKIPKPSRWDTKWRMIIFDIPERRRALRNKFRATLMHIGFLKLQDSVWIYPYDCEELVALLKADFRIGKDILYVIADSLENDGWIKRHFGLV